MVGGPAHVFGCRLHFRPTHLVALPSFRFGRWRHLVGQQRSCTCVVPALDRLARPGEAQSFPPIGNGPQTSHSQAATLGGTDGAQFHQHSLFAPPAFFSSSGLEPGLGHKQGCWMRPSRSSSQDGRPITPPVPRPPVPPNPRLGVVGGSRCSARYCRLLALTLLLLFVLSPHLQSLSPFAKLLMPGY